MNQYLVLDVTLDFHDLRIWVPLVRKQNEHGQLVNIILEQFSRKFIVGIVLAKLVGKMAKAVFISANDGDLLFEPIRAARDVLVDLVLQILILQPCTMSLLIKRQVAVNLAYELHQLVEFEVVVINMQIADLVNEQLSRQLNLLGVIHLLQNFLLVLYLLYL